MVLGGGEEQWCHAVTVEVLGEVVRVRGVGQVEVVGEVGQGVDAVFLFLEQHWDRMGEETVCLTQEEVVQGEGMVGGTLEVFQEGLLLVGVKQAALSPAEQAVRGQQGGGACRICVSIDGLFRLMKAIDEL